MATTMNTISRCPPVDLSIVVPCFNEEPCLEVLYSQLQSAVQLVNLRHELILVNDGSTDSTWAKIMLLCQHDRQVVGVNLSRNFGQEAAIAAGLDHCRGELILMLDADLQDPPELLADMLVHIREGADVVYGVRRSRAGETWGKRLTAFAFYWFLSRVANIAIPRNAGHFRLMRRCVLDSLLQLPEKPRYVRGAIAWVGYRQVPISFDRNNRLAGKSHWPWLKMIGLAADAVIAFSIWPLRLAFCFSATMGFVSVLTLVVWLIQPNRYELPGIIWLAIAAFSFMICLQMFALGVQGEYIGRCLEESRRRPRYIVQKLVNRNPCTGKLQTQPE